jgi:hypothetical protein
MFFNYDNIDEAQFEELATDFLKRKLGVNLRTFAKGKDGGIDATDNPVKPKIIMQAKHYRKSTYSDLKRSLGKELPKVKEKNPNQYYIVCSMALSPQKVSEIYSMFSDYMESDKNIITTKEIDSFLQEDENKDILMKYRNLWLAPMIVLTELINNNLFIDSEVLFEDIKEQRKYFVETESFKKCLNCLEENRMIMITGAPGVGKSFNSNMLVSHFAEKGYKVRYTNNGELSDLKKSLSADEKCKEIVLLDDCLGQSYFKMKVHQESEILNLLKYIRSHENKMLILNSRITILNEAKERTTDFGFFIDEENLRLHTINMDRISDVEKAKIFVNHLHFKEVPVECINNIIENKNYLRIVKHQNYTPRIIDYVTNKSRYTQVKPLEFSKFILNAMNNPQDIWKNEFDRLEYIDHIFMYTLFSLTNTVIDYEKFKRAFSYRLTQTNCFKEKHSDFNEVLRRLKDSLVTVYDNNSKKSIGVTNPSVNDFLNKYFLSNEVEVSKAKQSFLFDVQYDRCCSKKEFERVMLEKMTDETIFELDFITEETLYNFIVPKIFENSTTNENFTEMIYDYLLNYDIWNIPIEPRLEKSEAISVLIKEPFLSCYKIDEFVNKLENVEEFFLTLSVEELSASINILFIYVNENNFDKDYIDDFINMAEYCFREISAEQFQDVDSFEYIDNYDIHELFSDLGSEKETVSSLENLIFGQVLDLLDEYIKRLPQIISKNIVSEDIPISIDSWGIECEVREFLYQISDGLYKPYGIKFDNREKENSEKQIITLFEDFYKRNQNS